MILTINSIADAGDLERERLVLRASGDTQLGDFAVFSCNVFDVGKIQSGNVPDAFWFDNKEVKKGDFIVLYTKAGKGSSKPAENGSTSYFYYWGKLAALWTSKRRAIVVSTPEWASLSRMQPSE